MDIMGLWENGLGGRGGDWEGERDGWRWMGWGTEMSETPEMAPEAVGGREWWVEGREGRGDVGVLRCCVSGRRWKE